MSIFLRLLSAALVLALTFAVGCETEPTVDPDDLEDEAIEDPSWATDVQPILVAYCGRCHEGDATASGVPWLNSHDNVTADAFAGVCNGSQVADCIVVRINDGSMPDDGACPPGDEGCITEAQFATVENWIADGKPE